MCQGGASVLFVFAQQVRIITQSGNGNTFVVQFPCDVIGFVFIESFNIDVGDPCITPICFAFGPAGDAGKIPKYSTVLYLYRIGWVWQNNYISKFN